jgi:hypothetical protein
MCTLSFIPGSGGYVLAMNRDERMTRPPALPPNAPPDAAAAGLYPHEREGGTWIGVNPRGIGFALLNWGLRVDPGRKSQSRGTVIPRLLGADDLSTAARSLERSDLSGLLPFRLVGVFPGSRRVREWRWDLQTLAAQDISWEPRHWFSSGASDDLAEFHRSLAVQAAWREKDAGSREWLRALHRSHAPARGPFSLCAHREDAGSVSYTEIVCSEREIELMYHAAPPCLFGEETVVRLPLGAALEQSSHV